MELVTTILTPVALEVASIVALGAVTWVATTAQRRFGLDIEQRHRDALHRGIMSGVEAAMQRGLAGDDVIDFAMRHARASVGDAITHLTSGRASRRPRITGRAKPSPGEGSLSAEDVLRNIARSKAEEALQRRAVARGGATAGQAHPAAPIGFR